MSTCRLRQEQARLQHIRESDVIAARGNSYQVVEVGGQLPDLAHYHVLTGMAGACDESEVRSLNNLIHLIWIGAVISATGHCI